MTNTELADELEEWAKAREHVSMRRIKLGKKGLDSTLLIEAAKRLRGFSQDYPDSYVGLESDNDYD